MIDDLNKCWLTLELTVRITYIYILYDIISGAVPRDHPPGRRRHVCVCGGGAYISHLILALEGLRKAGRQETYNLAHVLLFEYVHDVTLCLQCNVYTCNDIIIG